MTAFADLEATLRMRRGLPDPQSRRALRQAAGASLSQVADVCGVSPQSVLDWERGADPRGEHLVRYSKVLALFEEIG
jgi:transcriptional regulator with XRE-family HTH domain